MPCCRRCQRVRFRSFLCFFLRIFLRRFLMTDGIREFLPSIGAEEVAKVDAPCAETVLQPNGP